MPPPAPAPTLETARPVLIRRYTGRTPVNSFWLATAAPEPGSAQVEAEARQARRDWAEEAGESAAYALAAQGKSKHELKNRKMLRTLARRYQIAGHDREVSQLFKKTLRRHFYEAQRHYAMYLAPAGVVS